MAEVSINRESYVKADRSFPRIVYHKDMGEKRVLNQEELEAALAAGFSMEPVNHPHANDAHRQAHLKAKDAARVPRKDEKK